MSLLTTVAAAYDSSFGVSAGVDWVEGVFGNFVLSLFSSGLGFVLLFFMLVFLALFITLFSRVFKGVLRWMR